MPRRRSNNSYAQRDSRSRGPQRAADIVAHLMAARGYGRVQTAAVTGEAWSAAAGERLAGHSRPGNLRRGVLEVFVRNSAVMQELTFQKKKILKKLLAALPESTVADLKFRVGAID